MTALTVQQETPKELTENQEKDITTYLQSLGSNLTNAQSTQFIALCREFQLNPFKREIYGVAYKSNFNIIVSYEVYIKRAEGTGKLDGWERGTTGTGSEMKAWIKIHRKDWKMPFYHEVDYSEYVQRKYDGTVNQFWATKPKTMLMKVVTAQAFRLAFPADFAGMPYTSDETPTGGDTSGMAKPEIKEVTEMIQGAEKVLKAKPVTSKTINKKVNVILNKEYPKLDPASEVAREQTEQIITADPVNQAEEFIKKNGGEVNPPEPEGIKMAPPEEQNKVNPEDAKRDNFWKMMCDMYGSNAPAELEKMTTFKGSNGMVPGKTDINRISAKQLNFMFRNVDKAYQEWKNAGGVPPIEEEPPTNEVDEDDDLPF